ncbi:MAG: phage integrase N-terminal SAM-like domain-containing protein [Verrucomicrobiia bacterium]
MRFKHYSRRTEETYLQWIRRFILFHRRNTTPHPDPRPRRRGKNLISPRPDELNPTPGWQPPSPLRWERDRGW